MHRLDIFDSWSDEDLEQLSEFLFRFGVAVPSRIHGKGPRAWLEHAKATVFESFVDPFLDILDMPLEDMPTLAGRPTHTEPLDSENFMEQNSRVKTTIISAETAKFRLSIGR